MLDDDRISRLTLGESVVIDGVTITRVGLCGPAALMMVTSIDCRGSSVLRSTPKPVAHHGRRRARWLKTTAQPAAPGVAATKPARPDEPEILRDVRGAVGRGFKVTHRRFDGGEAVVVTPRDESVGRTELERALQAVRSTGLYVEWGAGGGSLVVAETSAVLAPPARPRVRSK